MNEIAATPDLPNPQAPNPTGESHHQEIENWHKACQSVLERYLPCDSVNTLPGGVLQTLPPTPIALKVLPRNLARTNSQISTSAQRKENALHSPQSLLDSLPEITGNRGHRLAIIGDTGTGKTLFLQYIAQHLLKKERKKTGWPIWVSPSQLKNISLRDYLFQTWLKEVQEDDELPLEKWRAVLDAEIALGRVWILADGMDYLYSEGSQSNSAGPLSLILQALSSWGDALNIVITCHPETQRLDPKALRGFSLYHTQELTYPEAIEATIQEWFVSTNNKYSQEMGESLCQVLTKPEHASGRQWLTRPIRLTLCCRFWQSRPTEFPTQSAELYRILTEQFYQWKAEQANCSPDQQKEMTRCLGELGKLIFLEGRSRSQSLTQMDVETVFGKQSPLLRLSLQLGWLIPQGVVIENYWQRGYSFFDPTFQDYFTALGIEDWHFFLDTNSHCYRLFEAPWQRVMTLWWGRRDIKVSEKEAFLAALFNFNDHCGIGNFYGKRAQALAAIALREFRELEQPEQILLPLLNWCRESATPPLPLTRLAETIFEQTDRTMVLELLLEWLKKAEEETEYRQICRYLLQWGQGNPRVIAGLTEQLNLLEHSSLRFQVAETLGLVDPGNEKAIAVFLNALKDASDGLLKKTLLLGLAKVGRGQESIIARLLSLFPQNLTAQQFRTISPCLEIIGQDNQGVIARLQQLLRVNESGSLRCQIAECLERVDPGSPTAISVLVRLLQKNIAPEIRQQALYSLGEVSSGQQTVITALIHFLESDEDIFTRWLAVTSLAKVGGSHPGAIAVLEKQLQAANADLSNEANRGFVKEIVDALVKMDPGNSLLRETLSQLIQQSTDTETTQDCAALLGKLDPGNPEAIAALGTLIKNPQDEFTQRQAAESLGKIDPGNLKAVMTLIHLMQSSSSKDIRASAAASLGNIGNSNPVAIAALIRTINSSKDKTLRRAIILSLGKIGTNNKEVAQTLLDLLASAQDDSLCPELAEQLVRILPRKMLQSAICQLRNIVFPPTSLRARAHWEVLWHCAQFVPYPVFYQAWHQRPLSAGEQSSLGSTFGFSNQTSIFKNDPHQYLRQALMDVIQSSPDLLTAKIIWIDCDHFLEPDNPSIDIYDQMLSQGCPEFEHGIPDNLAKLRLYWHSIQRHQENQTYILMLDHVSGDSPPPLNPSFIEKLTTFQGNGKTPNTSIALLTEQKNLPLAHFSPQSPQVMANILDWIKDQLV